MSTSEAESSGSSDENASIKRRSKRHDAEEEGPFVFPIQRFSEALISGNEVYVSHLWNLSTMTVFAKQDQVKVEAMNDKVVEMHRRNLLINFEQPPQVGEMVVTPYRQDGGTYINRGIIEETFVNGEVVVLFIDLGDKARVQYYECFKIPNEIRHEPIYGMMVQVPGIPEEANSMLSKKLKDLLIGEHEYGFLKVEGVLPMMVSVSRPLQVESFLTSKSESSKKKQKMVAWKDVVQRAILCSGNQVPMDQSWNPWSTRGMEVISKACEGDREAIKYMVEYNLIEWSQQFYKQYLEAIKKYQINMMRTKSDTLLRADGFDDEDWSDTIKGFHYKEIDVPVGLIPPGEEITVRVRHFASPTDWTGIIISEPFITYQRTLRKILDKHCEKAMKTNEARGVCKRQFLPEVGEFCFIYLHTWKDMDRMMREDKRGKWQPRFDRRTPMDDQEANHWYRAVSSGPTTQGTYCRFWHCYLIDLGRFVVTPEEHILPGLLKFLLIPKLAIRGSFPIPCIGLKEDIKIRWYAEINKGMELDLRVLESEIHYKTLVEIVMNEKSKSLHDLISPQASSDLAEALRSMTIKQPPKYLKMISENDIYDDADDDY